MYACINSIHLFRKQNLFLFFIQFIVAQNVSFLLFIRTYLINKQIMSNTTSNILYPLHVYKFGEKMLAYTITFDADT